MNFKIENVESDKSTKIGEMIKYYNRSKREPSESVPLNIYYEDEYGTIKAGIVAETFGNWLEIEYLFVNEDLRGHGIGSKIIKMAEEEAKNRNCIYSFVDTFNFQAPSFYKKHGYKEVFTLKNYPYSGERYYYTKNL